MALVKAANGSKLLIRIDDGSGSHFVHQCSVNTSRDIVFDSAPIETLIPDCDDPDAPGWLERDIDSLRADITGNGMMDSASVNFFDVWWRSGVHRLVQAALNVPMADGGGYWQGYYVLKSFSLTGPERRQKITFACNMLSDGVVGPFVPA